MAYTNDMYCVQEAIGRSPSARNEEEKKMVTNDAVILRLKHDILYKVAKAAWGGSLDEKREQTPCSMIPGPQVTYRCCTYKERETIRRRVRLAEGERPIGKGTFDVAQVINAACEECPIASYIAMDSCHECMGRACQNFCNFGAISAGRGKAYIEPGKCRERGKCSQTCLYDVIAHLERPCKKTRLIDVTIYDKYDACVVDEKKCIQCGVRIHSCPSGAIGSKAFMVDVIRLIKAGKRAAAMVAPATEGQSGPDTTMASWKITSRQLGSADMIEVGLDGDVAATYEAEGWVQANKERKKVTTSCCPTFVNVIKQHFLMLLEDISTAVSPMCAVSRMIKSQVPDTVAVFIGPCIAKKSESLDLNVKGNADYVMTFGEIRAMMRAKGTELQPVKNDYQENFMFGERFGNGGGAAVVALECLKEMDESTDIRMARYNDTVECKEALLLMKVGELPEDFVEGIACVGGYMDGPSRHRTEIEVKKARDQLIRAAEKRRVLENLKKYPMDELSIYRH